MKKIDDNNFDGNGGEGPKQGSNKGPDEVDNDKDELTSALETFNEILNDIGNKPSVLKEIRLIGRLSTILDKVTNGVLKYFCFEELNNSNDAQMIFDLMLDLSVLDIEEQKIILQRIIIQLKIFLEEQGFVVKSSNIINHPMIGNTKAIEVIIEDTSFDDIYNWVEESYRNYADHIVNDMHPEDLKKLINEKFPQQKKRNYLQCEEELSRRVYDNKPLLSELIKNIKDYISGNTRIAFYTVKTFRLFLISIFDVMDRMTVDCIFSRENCIFFELSNSDPLSDSDFGDVVKSLKLLEKFEGISLINVMRDEQDPSKISVSVNI